MGVSLGGAGPPHPILPPEAAGIAPCPRQSQAGRRRGLSKCLWGAVVGLWDPAGHAQGWGQGRGWGLGRAHPVLSELRQLRVLSRNV